MNVDSRSYDNESRGSESELIDCCGRLCKHNWKIPDSASRRAISRRESSSSVGYAGTTCAQVSIKLLQHYSRLISATSKIGLCAQARVGHPLLGRRIFPRLILHQERLHPQIDLLDLALIKCIKRIRGTTKF